MTLNPAQLRIIACMYVGYGAMMISRQMVTILSPALLDDKSLGFTVKDTGDLLAFGTVGAMVGKAVWGPLADRIGGRLTFLFGIVLTGLLITGFGLSYNVIAFTAFSALSYGTKSSGWPAMTKMVGNWYHPSTYGRIWSILSTSSRASVVLGTLFFGWLLSVFHWRTVAFISTGTAIAIYLVCHFFLEERPRDPDFLETPTETDDPELSAEIAGSVENRKHHPLAGTNLGQALLAFARSPRCIWVVVMLMSLTCAMALLDFTPAYLKEVFKLKPSQASMASSAMPTGSLIGLVLSIFFYDRFSKKELRFILTGALLVATACIFVLQTVPALGLSTTGQFVSALLCIGLFGISIAPAYYIPMSIFSIEYGGPHSATLVSLIDMFSFAASASFGFIAGRVAASALGWDGFLIFMQGIAVAAAVATWFFMQGEYRALLDPRKAPRPAP